MLRGNAQLAKVMVRNMVLKIQLVLAARVQVKHMAMDNYVGDVMGEALFQSPQNLHVEIVGVPEEHSCVLVCFKGKDKLTRPYLRSGFKHCYIYVKRKNGWRLIESFDDKLIAKFLTNVSLQSIVEANQLGTKCLLGSCKPFNNKLNAKHKSCVFVTKKVLGINKPLLRTPFQLYNFLLDNNFKDLSRTKQFSGPSIFCDG